MENTNRDETSTLKQLWTVVIMNIWILSQSSYSEITLFSELETEKKIASHFLRALLS